MFLTMLQVAAGGAIGAVGRYLTGVAVLRVLGAGFPLATLIVNVIGSFAMGVLIVTLAHRGSMHLAPFLTVGMLGGFTTFSAFSLDTIVLFERGETGLALLYVALSVLASIGAVFAGMTLTRGIIA
ncbi:Putative fluoride ion transporter CrcB [Pseudoruegeria aquimaris]|uniref:Fluoride-specific ion channel FluC n=1 Tax=Pseudoruegeria aquimaris TaxID=393663 RepID=A0A1Y5SDR0_9RHOB|nr:fluoride efflux transporter CrcB [Pseudoruegeria aquimaris]SLN38256.1 Putative fluoride ion transporter CrcB [Pseudoruegeria aquimaris]